MIYGGRFLSGYFAASSATMQLAGHFFAHAPQPIHFAASIVKLKSFLHLPARHFLSWICSRYSSRKFFMVDITGLAAVRPSIQRDAFEVAYPISSSFCISDSSPLPSAIFSRILSICVVPMRHGEHLPQLSSTQKSM